MAARNEREIRDGVNRRDASAFLAAYDLYAPKVYRHALIRLSSHEQAEDTVSFAFMKAWEELRDPAFRVNNFKAFLFRIANNHIIDHWRGKGRIPASLDLMEDHEHPSVEERVTHELDAAFAHGEALQALACLPEEARRLVQWRFIDELSIKEIVHLSGKNAAAVYVAIHRALRRLERIFKEKRLHGTP